MPKLQDFEALSKQVKLKTSVGNSITYLLIFIEFLFFINTSVSLEMIRIHFKEESTPPANFTPFGPVINHSIQQNYSVQNKLEPIQDAYLQEKVSLSNKIRFLEEALEHKERQCVQLGQLSLVSHQHHRNKNNYVIEHACQLSIEPAEVKQFAKVKIENLQIGKSTQLLKAEIKKLTSKVECVMEERDQLKGSLQISYQDNNQLLQALEALRKEKQFLHGQISEMQQSIVFKNSKDVLGKLGQLEKLNTKLIDQITEIRTDFFKKEIYKQMLPIRQMKKIQLFERMTTKLNKKIAKAEEWKQKIEEKYTKSRQTINNLAENEEKYLDILKVSKQKLVGYEKMTTKWQTEIQSMVKDFEYELKNIKNDDQKKNNFQGLIKENILLREQVNILRREVYLKKSSNKYESKKVKSAYERRLQNQDSMCSQNTYVKMLQENEQQGIAFDIFNLKVPEEMPNLALSNNRATSYDSQQGSLDRYPISQKIYQRIKKSRAKLNETPYRQSDFIKQDSMDLTRMLEVSKQQKKAGYKYQEKIKIGSQAFQNKESKIVQRKYNSTVLQNKGSFTTKQL